jgi:hypothetical protein
MLTHFASNRFRLLISGKGGDLGKWTIHSRGMGNYVGLDGMQLGRKGCHDELECMLTRLAS